MLSNRFETHAEQAAVVALPWRVFGVLGNTRSVSRPLVDEDPTRG